jgi:hypothetical protein
VSNEALLSELERAKVLFQARAVAAVMGLPQPTSLDNRPDGSGLDDGPWLPGCAPRKKPEPKSPEELAAIRAKAWATRRSKE